MTITSINSLSLRCFFSFAALNFQDEDLLSRNSGLSAEQGSFLNSGSQRGGFNNFGRSTDFGSNFLNQGSGFGNVGFGSNVSIKWPSLG